MLRDEAISAGATSTKPRTAEIPSSLYRRTGLLLRNPSEKGPFRRFLRKADFGRGRSGAGRRGESQATGAWPKARLRALARVASVRPAAHLRQPSRVRRHTIPASWYSSADARGVPRCREPTPVL